MVDGIITISTLDYQDNSEKSLKDYRENNIPLPIIKGFSVGFEGHNEGSGSPCKDEEEAKKKIKELTLRHQDKYKIKIVDTRIKQQTL